jgi:hypothetical protein
MSLTLLIDYFTVITAPEWSSALMGESGPSFWSTYATLNEGQQTVAQAELGLDAFYCGWSPGSPAMMEVTPIEPIVPPIHGSVPEPATWLMLVLGFAVLMARSRLLSLRVTLKGA